MVTRAFRNEKELFEGVDMYLKKNDESFIPSNRNACMRFAHAVASTHCFLRVFEKDSKMLAWMYADRIQPAHVGLPVLYQQYFASDATGKVAVQAVEELHADMLAYADKNKIPYVMSQCSHLDERQTFVRILEKAGWKRRGFMAMHATRWAPTAASRTSPS